MLAPENISLMAGADFVAGFLYAMTGENNLTEVEACFQGGPLMIGEIEAGIADIKKGGWDNDVQAALQFALVALQIPQAIHTCENMDEDIAAIKSWASIFTDPARLAATVSKHMIFHGTEIKADIAALEGDWAAGLYFKSGADLADALTLAVGPIESTGPVEDTLMLPPLNAVPDFTAGLIYGFTGDNHLEELETCMGDTQPLFDDAEQFVLDIKSLKFVSAGRDIGDFLWQLPDAVQACTGMDDDIAEIEAWAEIFKEPTVLAKTVSKNWLFHGVKIKAEIAQQQADWAAAEYFNAGKDAADVLIDLIGPVEPVADPIFLA